MNRLMHAGRYSRIFAGILAFSLLAPMLLKSFAAQKPATKPNPMSTFDERHKQFLALLDEEWQYEMRSSPEFATSVGDNRYNDRWSDYSPEFVQSDIEQRGKFLARFEAIDATGFAQQDALSLKLMIRELKEQIEGAQFKNWEMPVTQRDGPQVDLPYLISLMPFNSLQDYQNYLSRLRQISRVFEQTTANMHRGISDRLMPPRYLLEKVSPESEEVAKQSGESSPFFGPLKQFPASISAADQKRLREDALNVIATQIIPAYQKFAVFVRDEYAPLGRTEPGVWSLPDGEARYLYAIKRMT